MGSTSSDAPPPIGHNQPPSGWTSYCWKRAHKEAWKTPPIEVVRRRVTAANGLGLTYRDYTAVLMDRGTHLQALHVSMPVQWGGIAKKLQTIKAGKGIATAFKDLTTTSEFQTFTTRVEASLTASALIARPKDLTGILGSLRLKPDAVASVGADHASGHLAEACGLARFIWLRDYLEIARS